MSRSTGWAQRRYGLLVANALAAVPAWAPVGQDPLRYRRHLGDVAEHPTEDPFVEVLAHHRDRWGHIARYDDFAGLLDVGPDEPEAWANLARDGGMGLSASSAKHHDGWCWWRATSASRTLPGQGQHHDVLAAHAAACERNGLGFGALYSDLDWADPAAGTAAHVDDVVLPELTELYRQLAPDLLWTSGHPIREDRTATVRDLLEQLAESGTVIGGTWLTGPPVTRRVDHPPLAVDLEPWVLCRGLGRGLGYNRAETEDHLLGARELLDLYLEVLAKGGALLLTVGVDGRGAVPDLNSRPIRRAGDWIQRHADLLDRAQPWIHWGDADSRILTIDGDVVGIDISGAGHFAGLTPDLVLVHGADAVTTEGARPALPRVRQDADGVTIDLGRTARSTSATPVMWRFRTSEPGHPIELFPPTATPPVDITALLANATPGVVIQLGEGRHVGAVAVPKSVTLRGLGPDRTSLEAPAGAPIALERKAHLEHLSISWQGDATTDPDLVGVVVVGSSATVLGCIVDGSIHVGADDATIRATSVAHVRAKGADRLSVSNSTFHGVGGDTGIHLHGGAAHLVDSCELHGHRRAIHAVGTTGTIVRGNTISARDVGVRLEHTENAHVHRNRIHDTTRAVDVEAGTAAVIDGNAVFDGDSGCVAREGASDVHVSGNHWERCRAGLIAWEVTTLHASENQVFDLGDEADAYVTGP